jgi:hypothetical protein
MEFLLGLWQLTLIIAPFLIVVAVFWAIVCYGFSMIRLWFKF